MSQSQTDEAGRAAWAIEIRDATANGIELYLDVANGDVLRQESSSLSDLARGPSGFNAVYVDANSGQVLFTEPAD